jgi:hypothetical protein
MLPPQTSLEKSFATPDSGADVAIVEAASHAVPCEFPLQGDELHSGLRSMANAFFGHGRTAASAFLLNSTPKRSRPFPFRYKMGVDLASLERIRSRPSYTIE